MVTHRQIDDRSVDEALKAIGEVAEQAPPQANGTRRALYG
jgi:hypothetical protein